MSLDAILTLKLQIVNCAFSIAMIHDATVQSIHCRTPAPSRFQNQLVLLSSVLTISRGRARKMISIGFLSQTSIAATITKIRMLESPRDNSRADKQCHTRADGHVVNGVVSSLETPSTLLTGHDAGCSLFAKLV